MKILKYSIVLIFLKLISLSLGAWLGYSYADTDVLCGDYADYKLLDNFSDQNGFAVPKGTIVKARHCKGNMRLQMDLVIEKWDIPLVEYQGEGDNYELIYLASQQSLDEDLNSIQ